MAEMTIREFQKRFKAGDFKRKYPDKKWSWMWDKEKREERDIAISAGWYDWFCSDRALLGKTKRLGSVVCQLKDSGKINLDTMYAWFKNNCPMEGPLYDDFRIADLESGDTRYCCCYNSPHEEEGVRWSVWGRENDFKGTLIGFKTAWEMVRWFNESKAG
jgi:hypothetical protein